MLRVGAELERRLLSELQYSEVDLVQEDLRQVRSVFTDLRLYCDFYCFPNKQKRRLLFLAGTIPVSHQGCLYNIPVCLWLHHTHPATRPRCCLCPSVSMAISPHCRYVDAHGNILLSRLHTWTQGRSSLVVLVSEMIRVFEKDTPLYARPLPLPQATPSGDHRTTPPSGDHRTMPPSGNHRTTPPSGNHRTTPPSGDHRTMPPSGDHRSSPDPTPHPYPHPASAPAPAPGLNPGPGPSPGPGPGLRSYCDDLKDIDFSPFQSPVHQQQTPAPSGPTPSDPETLLTAMTDLTLDPSGQSELRGHPSGQSELRVNRKPLLRTNTEEQREISQLPPHKLQMFLQLLQGRGYSAEGQSYSTEGQSYSTGELLEAVHLSEDLLSAQRFLHHQCPVCDERVSFSKMVQMTHCSCSLCESCFKSWFSSVIREKSVDQFVCPLCGNPDLRDQDQDQDQDYFNLLDTQIRHFLSPELHDLFQRKLRDRALLHMKHFCWCSHCSFGFVHESESLKMNCPSCNKSTCSRCRSPWSPEHQGVSCEDFRARIKTRTGPLFNCIECPDCGEVFSGSTGGCLHFSCLRCGTQFCGGCSRHFSHGQECAFSSACASRGLHAHHPRDCVYHLRDWSVSRLHLLLHFYRGSPTWINVANQSTDSAPSSGLCPELRDNKPCGNPAPHRGYCRSHYIERVVHLLNVLGADPVVLFSVEELEAELRRWNLPLPPEPRPPDLLYHAVLTQMVLQKVPLKTVPRTNPGLNQN